MTHICRFLVLLLFVVGHSVALGQEIPKGVRYKKASASVNGRAEALLRKLLVVTVPEKTIESGLAKAVLCGPNLWRAIKDVAPRTLKDAGKATMNVPSKGGTQTFESRFFKAAKKEIVPFWLVVLAFEAKYKGKKTIRKANAAELEYYWAIISFDIEEPLLVVDYGKSQLLVNFVMENGVPKVFYVELVAKLGK